MAKKLPEEAEWINVSQDLTDSAPERISPNIVAETATDEGPYPGFDPEIHRTDKDGRPVRKKNGDYALKTGAGSTKRKSKVHATVKSTQQAVGAEFVGKYTCDSFIMINTMILGEAAVPTPELKLGMEQATTIYMQSKGIDKDIPPGIMLLMALGTYYAHVFQAPAPRSRVSKIAGWVKSKLKRKGKSDGAYDDSRPDRERKDDRC